MKQIALMAIAAFILASCVSPEERIAHQAAACQQAGIQPGTDAMLQCIQIQQDAEARRQAASAQFWSNYHPMAPAAPIPAYHGPTQTNCCQTPGGMNCTTY